jgi:hypothetical protein
MPEPEPDYKALMDRSHFAQKPLGPEPSIEDINAEVEARHQEDLRRRAEVRATQIHEAAIKGAERATADATAGGTSVGRAGLRLGCGSFAGSRAERCRVRGRERPRPGLVPGWA